MQVGLAATRRQAAWAGLAEGGTQIQSWLWATAVAAVGETPSLTLEFLKKCTIDDQASCTVLSLAPPTQVAPQPSKQGCPAWVNT